MSTSTLDPITNPQDFDFITVDGAHSPGVCEVTGAVRKYKWDIKEGKGTQGATTTFVSVGPCQFKVKFRFWLAEHFLAWATFRNKLKYDPTKQKPGIFTIYYPTLADIEVSKCSTEDIGALEPDGKGGWSCTVSLLEYFPPAPKSVAATPTGYYQVGKQPGAGTGTQPDPAIVALQKQAAILAKQAQGTA